MASYSSTSMVGSSSLTDDILLEIFTNLPLKSINKLKCLSKVWLSNLSDPSFIIKWFRANNKSLPWIQYHSIPYQSSNPLRLRYAYPESHSEFMTSNEHYLFSLKFLIDKKQFQGAKVFTLGSSNGFLLCYSFRSEYQKRYHVCNPLTQKWVSLPSPPGLLSPISNLNVNGIFSEYSSSFTSCCYWVVRIPTFYVPSKKFNVDIFSSDLGVWQSIQVLCDKDVIWSRSRYPITAILNGVLFWIDGLDRMLAYNFIKKSSDRCSLIDLPDDDDGDVFESILGDSEGWLCYGRIRVTDEELTLSVWVLNEVNWKIIHKNISLGPVFVEAPSLPSGFARVRVLGFSPMDRNVVLLGWTQHVWGFNVQTRRVDKLSLGNAFDYDLGKPYLPFVLKPMPTVLPICRSNPEVKKRARET